ncbi:hypothetical protein H6G97_49225 [Nostoc flagelliforme FACHB-838]|uniref:Uncharacterized protein n=1 Tax=Nostoc flagelliforme FACHB-838 TaxID=2692904 RepID=A0ABR8E529_9NOSO|nr:hypothetical protein [Nostoc flagelliforme]MBD2536799.1 hypothetical protein [Nostoc flagelliforme FACHB-838]
MIDDEIFPQQVQRTFYYLPHQMVTINGAFLELTLADCKKATPRGGYIQGWENQDVFDIELIDGQIVTINLLDPFNIKLVLNFIDYF